MHCLYPCPDGRGFGRGIVRVFHLNDSIAGGQPPIYREGILRKTGESMPEPELVAVLRAMREDIKFEPGHITVKSSGTSIRNFENALATSDVETLKKYIRISCGYDVAADGKIVHLNTEERKHLLVETAIQTVECTYGWNSKTGKSRYYRLNGDPAAMHPLQAGATMAAVIAPITNQERVLLLPVIPALFHDVLEDHEDNSREMGGVRFRFKSEDGNEIILPTVRLIARHIKETYKEIGGNAMAKTVLHMTRPPKPENMDDVGKNDFYNRYLCQIYEKVWAALGKGMGDAESNKLNVENIRDDGTRERIRKSIVPKIIPQIMVWNAHGNTCAQLLMESFDELAKGTQYEGIEKELRAPSRASLEMFRKGFDVTGEARKFTCANMDYRAPSGSPILTIYANPKKEKNKNGQTVERIEMEIPFCYDLEWAREIVAAGWDKDSAGTIRSEAKAIPWKIDPSGIYSFAVGGQNGTVASAKKSSNIYDELLSSGALLEIFKGFDRQKCSKETELKWKPNMDSPRLQQFKLYRFAT